jgi:hypothetical protein
MDNPLAGLSDAASRDPLSDKNSTRTPPDLFGKYNEIWKFTLDAAADHTNALCDQYATAMGLFTKSAFPGLPPIETMVFDRPIARDGVDLARKWRIDDGPVWINPPYGLGQIEPFIDAWGTAYMRYGVRSVMLLPARTGNAWYKLWVPRAREVEFIGRVGFLDHEGRPILDKHGRQAKSGFDCMVISFF